MKRDTGDEIRMKLRYGRSNPWFSIRRVLSLPPSSPSSPPMDTLLQFVCPCAGATYKGCVQPRIPDAEEGISFFVLPFFSSLFPLFSRGNSRLVFNIFQNSGQKAVSRVEIRIRGRGEGGGGIKSRDVFERRVREFERGNCGKVVERVVEGLKT